MKAKMFGLCHGPQVRGIHAVLYAAFVMKNLPRLKFMA